MSKGHKISVDFAPFTELDMNHIQSGAVVSSLITYSAGHLHHFSVHRQRLCARCLRAIFAAAKATVHTHLPISASEATYQAGPASQVFKVERRPAQDQRMDAYLSTSVGERQQWSSDYC